MSSENSQIILSVEHLSVDFEQKGHQIHAVKDVSFELTRGSCLGIVGESGSGKSVTSLSILNLLADNKSSFSSGTINYKGALEGQMDNLLKLSRKQIRSIRGKKISIVFQEPMSSLNPVIRCGDQVAEVLKTHKIVPKRNFQRRVLDLFSQVSLPDIERVYSSYPHELSGGQLQRVNIAMALAGEPDILICDEPTTALDVTVQREIIDLIKSIIVDRSMSMIFVSHDLNLVQAICNHVVVMYKGQIVESGKLPGTFLDPQHDYTKALLICRPTADNRDKVLPTVGEVMNKTYAGKLRHVETHSSKEELFAIKNLTVSFAKKKKYLWSRCENFNAIGDLSFTIYKGEVLGIVGESGSGKSTIAKCIAGMIKSYKGKIFYNGELLNAVRYHDVNIRKSIQMIFQDPYSSLNPMLTIDKAIEEPIAYHKLRKSQKEQKQRALELMQQVGLDESFVGRYPHQLSGGQRQRVCIARALALEPSVLICDESVSALDVSVQAQILNLLEELRREYNLTMLFISHDLEVVHYLSDRVIVMEKGSLIETGTANEIFYHPNEAYTQRLVQASNFE